MLVLDQSNQRIKMTEHLGRRLIPATASAVASGVTLNRLPGNGKTAFDTFRSVGLARGVGRVEKARGQRKRGLSSRRIMVDLGAGESRPDPTSRRADRGPGRS